ncbi:GNAT family N-acetyltransferase [Brevibacillus centrosporus]|uniref:Protein N-acetyltransferase, RimJ/RimL family n=1 Tax=Brevibacillus centrosporus TaxID=54910 RepID=A0A1I3PFY3_9BACL|nr:GNAT family protein [Brevibacillus centrosporus]MEC2132958.1 GNAT family protein [Brevibacillus centrosporus]MED4910877.1 GNAT family protein [Brevibacillus centrosporus]RNB73527.1 N-acetyltransferase [Brevibacillus centrosporus]SFJ20189.1 Protein N-acetyltransferase, RimJ/RimL family [Brevibacillus centrosporus]GED31936.1 N-acetyltransferase [Brevibacillus centrosporus]
MLNIAPVTLEGKYVRLEPLRHAHIEGIWEAGRYENIWTYMSVKIDQLQDAVSFVETALRNEEEGIELPFAIIGQEDGKVIGSTRFLNIARKDRGLEIGFTWLTPSVWKSVINTECKYLLMRHCFEQLGCIRVQLKTDSRNLNSQRAIARIGGVREGVLRNHMILPDGYVRDSVYFSITNTEWKNVQEKLHLLLFRE